MHTTLPTAILFAAAVAAFASPLSAQLDPPTAKPECRTGTTIEPAALLARSLHALGVDAAGDRVLHFRSRESASAREQSDRWYPPYLNSVVARDVWVDPRTGAERHTFDTTWPGLGVNSGTILMSQTATFAARVLF